MLKICKDITTLTEDLNGTFVEYSKIDFWLWAELVELGGKIWKTWMPDSFGCTTIWTVHFHVKTAHKDKSHIRGWKGRWELVKVMNRVW